ncbi:four helix bundle protein [Patescibacteria group bacterium]
MDKIRNFTDLIAWQEARRLFKMTYEVTISFPKEELYVLVSQMRCCVLSVTSNIAEGFGRPSSRDKIRFYSIAQGSLVELQNQLIASKDLGYLNDNAYQELELIAVRVNKLISGLIKSSPKLSKHTKY